MIDRTAERKDHNNDDKDEEQLIREKRKQQQYNRSIISSAVTIPPYSLWVEGDNHKIQSYDSRPSPTHQSHGPLSKKLVVGIAEFVVWPPTRIGWIENNNNFDGGHQEKEDGNGSNDDQNERTPSRPRAYWP